MENVLLVLALLAVGVGLRRLAVFPPNAFDTLAQFVIYVSLPALILIRIPTLPLSTSMLAPIVMPWAMLVFSATAVLLFSRLFRWNQEVTGTLLFVVPLGNTSFLGIPLVQWYFGDEAVPYALLYDQLGTFLALATYGSFVAAFYGQGAERASGARYVLRRIVTFPPFLAICLAFATRHLSYPSMVKTVLEAVAVTLVPIVMVAVGLEVRLRLPKPLRQPVAVGLGIKLALAPLVALLFCRLMGLHGRSLDVAVFEAGMPSQISAGAMAVAAGLPRDLVAPMIGYGVVISFVTLWLLHSLL